MERNNHTYLRIYFKELVARQLPLHLVRTMNPQQSPLEVLDLNDIIDITFRNRTPEQTKEIMKICIRALEPEDTNTWSGNTPYAVLHEFNYLNTRFALFPRASRYLVKFDGDMYALTRSPECQDSERILEMFCTRPARIIQYAWKRYQKRKRDQASRIIQEYVRNWLYRPGGPMMKKAETSFYTIASKQ
jgi:hypothetical protein